jgi:heat shock protein HslJ
MLQTPLCFLPLRRALSAGLLALMAATAPVLAGDWRIATVNGVPAEGDAAMLFVAEGRISLRTGCNVANGNARFDAGALTVGTPLAMTRALCAGTALQAQEDALVRLLTGTIDVRFDPFTDRMTLVRGADSAELVAVQPETGDPVPRDEGAGTETSPDPAQPTAEERRQALFSAPYVNVFGLSGPLNVRQGPSTGSAVVGKVLAGTLMHNEGCEARADRDWCEVRFLDASQTHGWAAAEYLEPSPASLRAGQGVFDAIGRLACAEEAGAPLGDCDYGLARDGTHSVVVVVFRPDGMERVLFFADGGFAYADTSQAGGGFDTESTLDDGVFRIRVDSERYEIPETVVMGG